MKSAVSKSKLVIYENETKAVVYDDTQEDKSHRHTLPAGRLINGKYYSAQLYTYDFSQNISEASNLIDFYCFSTPEVGLSLTPGQVVSTPSFVVSVFYRQPEGELLNTYSLLVKEGEKEVFSSGRCYAAQGMDVMVTGLESGRRYTMTAAWDTVNGMRGEAAELPFSVQYVSPYLSALLAGENNPTAGTVTLKFDIRSIFGKTEKDAIYIDGEKIDLRADTVTFPSGFRLLGDYTIQMDCSDLQEYCTLLALEDTFQRRVTVEYLVDTFDGFDGPKAYLELKAYESGICYDRLSNYIEPPLPGQTLHIWIRKLRNLYELKVQ